jgi:hypothetical protein
MGYGSLSALNSRCFPTPTGASGGCGAAPLSRTMPPMKRLVAPSLVIVLCGMAAARDEGPANEVTAKAIAKLEAKLGKSEFEVDEVRVTEKGVACVDYHGVGNSSGKQAHAVLVGEELLISTSGDQPKKFEKAWSDHCLGPRGGATPNQ